MMKMMMETVMMTRNLAHLFQLAMATSKAERDRERAKPRPRRRRMSQAKPSLRVMVNHSGDFIMIDRSINCATYWVDICKLLCTAFNRSDFDTFDLRKLFSKRKV